MFYIWVYCSFFLGDIGRAFNTYRGDYPYNPSPDTDNITRYESLYVVDRPQNF